jgi:hypothetical protein
VDPPGEDEVSRWVAVIMTLRVPVHGKVGRCLGFRVRGELGNRRPVSCPVLHYKYRHRRGVGGHLFFLVLRSGLRFLCSPLPWHSPSAFAMDPGKRPTGDASSGERSTRRRVTRAGSSSGGGHGRRLPLAMTAEPVQPLDVVSSATAETEVERLRRYLEVS